MMNRGVRQPQMNRRGTPQARDGLPPIGIGPNEGLNLSLLNVAKDTIASYPGLDTCCTVPGHNPYKEGVMLQDQSVVPTVLTL